MGPVEGLEGLRRSGLYLHQNRELYLKALAVLYRPRVGPFIIVRRYT